MKKHLYRMNSYIRVLNKIYFNVCKLNESFDNLIDLASDAKSGQNLTGSVSPIIQSFKPQNHCTEKPEKKSKDTIEV